MHKGVGVGIELLIQLSPRPTPFSDREDDASRVGLGIFKNYSLIRSLGLVAPGAIEKRGGNESSVSCSPLRI